MKQQKSRVTRVFRIKELFKYVNAMSLMDVTKIVIDWENIKDPIKKRYLSGSISTVLHSLVKKGYLCYDESITKRGGHIYKLNEHRV